VVVVVVAVEEDEELYTRENICAYLFSAITHAYEIHRYLCVNIYFLASSVASQTHLYKTTNVLSMQKALRWNYLLTSAAVCAEKFTSAADAAMATPPPPVQADIETAIPETPPPPPRRKPKKPTTLGGKVKRIAGGLLRRALGRGPSQNQ